VATVCRCKVNEHHRMRVIIPTRPLGPGLGPRSRHSRRRPERHRQLSLAAVLPGLVGHSHRPRHHCDLGADQVRTGRPPVNDHGCLPMIWLLDRRWTTQAVLGRSSSPATLVGPSPARLTGDDLVTGSSIDNPEGPGLSSWPAALVDRHRPACAVGCASSSFAHARVNGRLTDKHWQRRTGDGCSGPRCLGRPGCDAEDASGDEAAHPHRVIHWWMSVM
jgi:hypothetical protein